MKKVLTLCACVLSAAMCAAQAPSTAPEWVGHQLSIVGYPTPQVTTAAAWRSAGNPGLRTLYYWIVANGVSDSSSPAGPFAVSNAPDALSASAKVTVSWQPVAGASSYDVLRTSTNQPPSANCNCAVATGVTSTSKDDISETLQSYNPTSVGKTVFTLTNEQYSAGVQALRVRFKGSPVFDWRSDGVFAVSNLAVPPTVLDSTGILETDQSTPANPASGKTRVYSKGGKLCSLDPSGNENCTGAGGGATPAGGAGDLQTNNGAGGLGSIGQSVFAKVGSANTFTQPQTMPKVTFTDSSCTSGTYAKGDGTGCGTPSASYPGVTANGSNGLTISGTPTNSTDADTVGARNAAIQLGSGGVWQRAGTVMTGLSTEEFAAQEPHVIYDGNPVILTGNTQVFKMWWTCGWNGPKVCYAESVDALTWTRYASNPVISTPHAHGSVMNVGGTYYYYGVHITGVPATGEGTAFDQYTSSDGVNWTLAHANVMTTGTSGAWDDTALGNIEIIINGGTWYAFYEASGTLWQSGLATSTDGVTWTKYSGNPTMSGGSMSHSHPHPYLIGGKYYVWLHGGPSPSSLPTDVYFTSSTDPHTFSSYALVYRRATQDEGMNTTVGQIGDPFLLEVNGNTYMFYSALEWQSPHASYASGNIHIKLAIAGMTMANLVNSVQGAGAVFGGAIPQAAGNGGTVQLSGPNNMTGDSDFTWDSVNHQLAITGSNSASPSQSAAPVNVGITNYSSGTDRAYINFNFNAAAQSQKSGYTGAGLWCNVSTGNPSCGLWFSPTSGTGGRVWQIDGTVAAPYWSYFPPLSIPLQLSASSSGTKDTSISRISAGYVAVGNGTASDASGTVQANQFCIGASSPSCITSWPSGSGTGYLPLAGGTMTGAIVMPSAFAYNTPAISFGNNSGIATNSNNGQFWYVFNSKPIMQLCAACLRFASGINLQFGDNADVSLTSHYTTMGRVSQGVMGFGTDGDYKGTVEAAAFLPGVLYSAAGTPLPTCAAGIKGQLAVVSDATTPTYMGAYISGGGITAPVICSYNGSTYSWLTY